MKLAVQHNINRQDTRAQQDFNNGYGLGGHGNLAAQQDINRQFGFGGISGDYLGGILSANAVVNNGMQQAQMAANRARAISDMQMAAATRLF
jgi:hypothetical protein